MSDGVGVTGVFKFGITGVRGTLFGGIVGSPVADEMRWFLMRAPVSRSSWWKRIEVSRVAEYAFTGTLTTIMHKVLKEDPIAPSELNVQVPAAFDGMVRKALAKRSPKRGGSTHDIQLTERML